MAPTTPDELHRLLAAHGLPLGPADSAVTGLALVGGGAGKSKLGGRPDLPGPWPINNGRGLTHLASIALQEVQDGPWRAQLPEAGTVVFFADLSFENEGWSPAVGTDPVIEILHVPTGAATATSTPPDEQRDEYEVPVVLNERSVNFVPVLTLPAEEMYEALDALESPDAFLVELDMPAHLLLGEPEYIQGDPREPGELSLLHSTGMSNWASCTGTRDRSASTETLKTCVLGAGNTSRPRSNPASRELLAPRQDRPSRYLERICLLLLGTN